MGIFRIAVSAVFLLGFGAFLFLALWHRQIFSEDCRGDRQFAMRHFGQLSDSGLKESSGLAFFPPHSFLTHNDDTDSALYAVNPEGSTRQTWWVGARNRDWEEICPGDSGRYFLGDIGNNFSQPRLLKIHILNPGQHRAEGTIFFRYPDFNTRKWWLPGTWDFDCEAMVWHRDSLYLFTKNKDERSTTVYALLAKPGRQIPVRKHVIPLYGLVTAASLRSDAKELALLTYGKIYFFALEDGLNRIPEPSTCLAAWKIRQSESIAYWGRDSLLVGNEQRDLFLVTRK